MRRQEHGMLQGAKSYCNDSFHMLLMAVVFAHHCKQAIQGGWGGGGVKLMHVTGHIT